MPPRPVSWPSPLTAQAPADNPADLAGRVASADPAAREEAEGRLEEMGRAALPALRIAAEKAEDPVAARRLADLIDLIERRRLLRATPVALDLKDAPVAEAVAELSRGSGLRVALDPPDDPAWARARITLATRGPIGFWDAVDRLGAAGGLRVEPVSYWANSPKDVPAVRLVRGEGSPVRPSYAGPYRVELTSLDRHRQVARPREGRPPKVVDEFTASLQLVAEPGILVDRNGSPRLLEALDDRGADLRPPSARDPSSPRMGFSFRQWRPTLEVETYRIPLAIPAARGGTLKRLRGVLPIIAYARTGPLVSVPLGAAVNRPLSASGVTLTVRRLDRGRLRLVAPGRRPRRGPHDDPDDRRRPPPAHPGPGPPAVPARRPRPGPRRPGPPLPRQPQRQHPAPRRLDRVHPPDPLQRPVRPADDLAVLRPRRRGDRGAVHVRGRADALSGLGLHPQDPAAASE